MSDQYALVLEATKKIENLLNAIGSEGRGLTEKCRSVEHLLPPEIAWSIKKIAAERNKLVHESGFRLSNADDFSLQAGSVIEYLQRASKPDHEGKRQGLTITILNFPDQSDALAEMEWFSSQPILFPIKEQPEDDPDD
ncbi:hypothetical protein HNP03_002535 [Pseudomonas rhodesiae]|uniref:hypothetical protein n=1 Tax=Pseudomonas rhodesiae TaxID=76760 RepID=UPI00161B0446|nr:hypothetical protein [Pseudomonas rhodesiae]MBB4813908.1 hypothetical protein [Pseudomonas rhodesiae]